MNVHRERLIACGLFSPLSSEEIIRRNGLLARLNNGEKMDSCVRPDMCVFRSDGPFTHVQLSGDHCCKEAELIADKLTYCEAQRLCERLNWNDPKLPPTYPKSPYRQTLYKICSMKEWEVWKAQKLQMSIFDAKFDE